MDPNVVSPDATKIGVPSGALTSGLKLLIIDDERLARVALRRMLRAHPDVIIAEEAANAEEALARIRKLQPDIVFLDIEMPGTTGLEMLKHIERAPLVVFTTAYPEHAVCAFEIHALDYLLKPILAERLSIALDRAREALLQRRQRAVDRKLQLREGKTTLLVPIDQIYLLQSEGNYTRVYFHERGALIYSSLNALWTRLDPEMFFRVSRTHIVNVHKIQAVEPHPRGGLKVTIANGLKVRVSRRRSRLLRRSLPR